MKHVLTLFLIVLISAVMFTACDNEPYPEELEQQEDVEITARIIADELSKKEEGLFAGLHDVMHFQNLMRNANQQPSFNYSYNPESGIHSIRFVREMRQQHMHRKMTARLHYQFLDQDAYIEFPGSEDFDTIRFRGVRDGFLNSPRRNTEFNRTTNWVLRGFEPASDVIAMQGLQHGSGSALIYTERGRILREYENRFSFQNIRISKNEGAIGDRVSGEIHYHLKMRAITPQGNHEREKRGTIYLSGNGQALLRIDGITQAFRIILATGDVTEAD